MKKRKENVSSKLYLSEIYHMTSLLFSGKHYVIKIMCNNTLASRRNVIDNVLVKDTFSCSF